MKKAISLFLSIVLVLGVFLSVPFTGLPFNITAEAASVSDLTFELNDDGVSYSVTACDEDASGALAIPGTYNGKPVTSIGDYAFEYCYSLTSITIPDSVTSIGDCAFYECSSLTSITIPDSVTSIGEDAFYRCDSLTSVTIGNSVTSIGDYAFSDCESLTSITIPDSVTSIGGSAFEDTAYYNDSSNWDNRVLYIGNHLIEAENSISGSYDIKAGTKTIADWAFHECDSLTSITIPDSVTSIGNWAFSYCYSLTSITIPDSVTSIGDYAFYNCSSLKSVTIPDSVTSIGEDAFSFCESLTSVTIPDSVTSIGYEAFSGCDSLTSITIPDSVTSIGNYAFSSCDSLMAINVSSSHQYYTSVDGILFNKDKTMLLQYPAGKKYNFYTIPDSVMSIGNGAFDGCHSLTSITIPDSVTSIGNWAFSYCTSLKSITIPDSVTSIGYDAFYNTAYYNNSSNWENGVLYIGNHLIAADESISGSYDIKAGTKTIADDAFYWCRSLTSIMIPNSVTSIGGGAFWGCESLTSITIPDSVTSIGEDAFYWCNSLTAINVSPNNQYYTSVDGVLFNKAKTELIQYPASKTNASYTIPSSVTNIWGSAFHECTSLTSITIPDSVTSIGDYAFLWCDSLTDVYYSGSSEDWSNISIGSYNDSLLNATIHYNSGSCSHTSTKWVTDKVATCTVAGSKHKECTVCGETLETEAITATGHTSSDWITDKKATVNAAGSQHKECTECGEVLETAVIPQLKPSNPTLSKAANANGGVTVTWKAVSGADSYRVYRKTSSTSWTCLNSKVTSTSYTDKSAKSGTTYYYTVRAENEAGLSGYNSTGVSVKYLAMPTATIANASTGVKVSWNKISGASKYYVYRKASGDKSWTQLTNSATGTSYTDTKAKSGTTYYYTVKAVSGSTSSEYKSSSALKYLAQPKVSSLSNTNSGITVKWGKITGASGYYVYRKTGSGSWSLIYTVKSGSTVSYTDKSAKAGTTYYYTVRAYSGSVKSTYTSSSAVRRLTTPTLKSVSSAKSGITFKWSKVTGASGYYVYRKTGSGSWQKIATVKSGSTVSYLDKTAKKGTTYTYTVKAYYSSTVSAYNTTGLKIKDKY